MAKPKLTVAGVDQPAPVAPKKLWLKSRGCPPIGHDITGWGVELDGLFISFTLVDGTELRYLLDVIEWWSVK